MSETMESMVTSVEDCELIGVDWHLPGVIPLMETKGAVRQSSEDQR
jgi:hypothetical protein